jgi:hypothetical protein
MCGEVERVFESSVNGRRRGKWRRPIVEEMEVLAEAARLDAQLSGELCTEAGGRAGGHAG